MRMYIEAECESGMNYVADWLAVTYGKDENGEVAELVFDVQGEQDISGCIKTRAKGIVPWVLREHGDEKIVTKKYSDEEIIKIIRAGTYFRIGLYPFDDSKDACEKAENDKFTNCFALLHVGDEKFHIKFEAEANI